MSGGYKMSTRNRESLNAALDFALSVLEAGWATIAEIRQANDWNCSQRPKLGKLAMTQGKLSMAQVFAIFREQAMTGKLFGEQAEEMALLDKGEVYELLTIQAHLTPTLAQTLVDRGVITPDQASFASKQIGAPPPCDLVNAETASS
jgi:hypothetical protein